MTLPTTHSTCLRPAAPAVSILRASCSCAPALTGGCGCWCWSLIRMGLYWLCFRSGSSVELCPSSSDDEEAPVLPHGRQSC